MNGLRTTVLGALTLLALAGCSSGGDDPIASAGGPGSSTASTAQASDEEKAHEFVDCMRDNGVDLPDPEPDGDGGFDFGLDQANVGVGDPGFQKALKACRDKLPGGGSEYFDDPEVQAQLREFAQCMRDKGIDFPDPDPDGGFGGELGDLDRTSPAFQSAMEACKDKLPARGGK
jgi:hypothetical protein